MKPRYVCTATTKNREIRFYVAAATMKKALTIAEDLAKSVLGLKKLSDLERLKLDEREPVDLPPLHPGQKDLPFTKAKDARKGSEHDAAAPLPA